MVENTHVTGTPIGLRGVVVRRKTYYDSHASDTRARRLGCSWLSGFRNPESFMEGTFC